MSVAAVGAVSAADGAGVAAAPVFSATGAAIAPSARPGLLGPQPIACRSLLFPPDLFWQSSYFTKTQGELASP